MMEKWIYKLHYTWIYLGLLIWCAIVNTWEQQVDVWHYYSTGILTMAVVLSPVLVFSCFSEQWRNTWPTWRYALCWLITFGLLLPLTATIGNGLVGEGDSKEMIFGGAIWAFVIEVALQLSHYIRGRGRQHRWLQSFNLEKAILLSIALISIILGIFTISSIGKPRYYNSSGNLLVGGEFDLHMIITHFGTFLGFAAQYFLMYLCGYFFFYINSHLLVAKVLKNKGILAYILCTLTVIGCCYPLLAALLNALPITQLLGPIFSANPFKAENGFAAATIVAISLPIVLAIQLGRQHSHIASLEKDKAETELGLLKQQLNPHFFFNTLNNLYALSLHQSGKTPESILHLSELMRYVIYKGQEPGVSIQEEIKYIEDYMELQQIRLRKPLQGQFKKDITNVEQVIPPMLLIVLVENAFKHGIEPAEDTATLELILNCTATQLYFSCINSFEQPNEKPPGIGLTNLQKRLSLLYPGKHTLYTSSENHIFKATLQLDLT
ncbi:sensor histidine kinase [Chitinophaga pendula]|uniref:sensor histidine kinase n=1 Tax=Chitinophaga TaxID=79328 RepID=UPI000BAF5D9A|nr:MULTISPECIES: sensor histidine kinase [Chitinophaga]ASZ11000.1 hypothetical protein CK934_08505 [Chitinophaga sp. MD30]UCJ06009.1 sensor histidine kinase [Chitinophaga pendula]